MEKFWKKVGIGTISTALCMGTVFAGTGMAVLAEEETVEPVAGVAAEKDLEPMQLTAVSGYPDTHCWGPYFWEMMNAIEVISGGAYTVDFYPGGQLVALSQELDAINEGTTDFACGLNAFADNRFPYSQVTMLPATYIDENIGTDALWDLLQSDVEIEDGKTFLELDYTDNGVVPFPAPSCDSIHWAVTKGHELNSVDDLNADLTVRTSSRIANLLCDNLGVTPLTVVSSEIYDTMSRGACNSIMMNNAWADNGILELLTAVYATNFGTYCTTTIFPIELWESFDEDFRNEFTAWYRERVHQNPWTAHREEQFEALEAQGSQVLTYEDMDPELVAAIEEGAFKTWEDWIAAMEEEGHPGARKLACLWRDIVVEHGGSFPDEIMAMTAE